MSSTSARRTTRTIERIQDCIGDGGCFFELHNAMRKAVTKLEIAESFLHREDFENRLFRIRQMASSLPPLHSDAVLTTKLRELDKIVSLPSR